MNRIFLWVQYYTILLTNFLKSFIVRTDKSLPSLVGLDETLARNIIGGGSPKSIKRLYNPNTKEIKPSEFMDSRNPRELSVNRISTLDMCQAHTLGVELTDEINTRNINHKKKIYHGYGKIGVQVCLKAGCSSVEKDDYNGSKPYHANIIYPEKEKFEEMEIANILAFHAEFIENTLHEN